MGTCQRPASRPYFFVTSSGEDCWEGLSISSVFSLSALTLKPFFTWDLRVWNEARVQILLVPLLSIEAQEGDGSRRDVVIAGPSRILYLTIEELVVWWMIKTESRKKKWEIWDTKKCYAGKKIVNDNDWTKYQFYN